MAQDSCENPGPLSLPRQRQLLVEVGFDLSIELLQFRRLIRDPLVLIGEVGRQVGIALEPVDLVEGEKLTEVLRVATSPLGKAPALSRWRNFSAPTTAFNVTPVEEPLDLVELLKSPL